jgi:hypothetical protein
MWRKRGYAVGIALATLAACGGATEPGVPLVVGDWCASLTPTATQQADGSWFVVIPKDVSEFHDVPGRNGVLVRQEVRSCAQPSCVFGPANASRTAAEVISACRQLVGG